MVIITIESSGGCIATRVIINAVTVLFNTSTGMTFIFPIMKMILHRCTYAVASLVISRCTMRMTARVTNRLCMAKCVCGIDIKGKVSSMWFAVEFTFFIIIVLYCFILRQYCFDVMAVTIDVNIVIIYFAIFINNNHNTILLFIKIFDTTITVMITVKAIAALCVEWMTVRIQIIRVAQVSTNITFTTTTTTTIITTNTSKTIISTAITIIITVSRKRSCNDTLHFTVTQL